MVEGKHLVIACGGTGGHFYPTLGIAEEFVHRCPGGHVTFFLSGKHSEEQAEQIEGRGFSYRIVPSVRMPSGLKGLFGFPFRLLSCIRRSKTELRQLHPDAVLGMGSFAAVPTCFAVDWKRTPLILHEGNAFMGKANRLFMRLKRARAIGLTLPLADEGQLYGGRGVTVGMPLREAIVEAATGHVTVPVDYLESLGLRNGVKTVLVFGGSQGARAVNEAMAKTVSLLTGHGEDIQFIHLTGTDDNSALESIYKDAGIRAYVSRGERAIERCYLSSDLVICRGGASSICELAVFGKAAIVIPLPTAADDHQTANARVLAAAEAAYHLPQAQATPEKLKSLLEDWLADASAWNARGENIHKLGRVDAAAKLVDLVLDCLKASAN